jgi:RNA polymerase III subunit RPC82 helix-turn-helix domain
MSILSKNLCSIILKEHFGENVMIVANSLFVAKAKTLAGLCKSTKLSKNEVRKL